MKKSILLLGVIPVLVAVFLGQLKAQWNRTQAASWSMVSVHSPLVSSPAIGEVFFGPDIIVSRMDSINKSGTIGNITAYSISTTSCNIGDLPAEFIDTGALQDKHPLIAQNMYRYKDGRLEQIGMDA